MAHYITAIKTKRNFFGKTIEKKIAHIRLPFDNVHTRNFLSCTDFPKTKHGEIIYGVFCAKPIHYKLWASKFERLMNSNCFLGQTFLNKIHKENVNLKFIIC